MILSKNYFLIYSSVYIVDLEQVITGGVIFFKKLCFTCGERETIDLTLLVRTLSNFWSGDKNI